MATTAQSTDVKAMVVEYESWGMTPRAARKKAMIILAYQRAEARGDRRRVNKWMHANTAFDLTRVNGKWSVHEENRR